MESEAPPSAGFYNFLGWLETNKKSVAMLVAGLLVAGTVAGFFAWRSGQRAMEAEEALSAMKAAFSPNDPLTVGTADALVKIAQEYAGTPAAAKAQLRAGTAYFSEGNYAKSQDQFNSYIQKYGDTPWVSQAVFGVAAALDAQKKSPEAITKYTDFIRSFPNDPSVDQARLNLARLYEQTQQPALALDTLNKLTGGGQPGNYSPASAEAEEKKKELLAKNPSGEDNAYIHPKLGVYMQPLPFIEYVLEDLKQAVLFSGETAILANVPDPARYALHKLIVYGERSGEFRTKGAKDLQQAAALLSLLAGRYPGDIGKAWKDLLSRGKGWRARARIGLEALCKRFPQTGFEKLLPQPKAAAKATGGTGARKRRKRPAR